MANDSPILAWSTNTDTRARCSNVCRTVWIICKYIQRTLTTAHPSVCLPVRLSSSDGSTFSFLWIDARDDDTIVIELSWVSNVQPDTEPVILEKIFQPTSRLVYYYTTSVQQPIVRDKPSEPVPERQNQEGKTNLDLLEQEIVSGNGISWAICKSSPRPRQITSQHPTTQFFYWCPSCCPTNSVKALKRYLITSILRNHLNTSMKITQKTYNKNMLDISCVGLICSFNCCCQFLITAYSTCLLSAAPRIYVRLVGL